MLIAGIVLALVGLSDFVVAGVLARRGAAATGGLGAPEPPAAARVLRLSGVLLLVAGVVLILAGL